MKLEMLLKRRMMSPFRSRKTSFCSHTGRRSAGFTYVELMITLGIMGVLASVAIPSAKAMMAREREHELRINLVEIREAIDAYKRAADQGRIELKLGDSGYPHRLSDLVEGVKDRQSLDGKMLYFLRRIPRDPMDATANDAESSWGKRAYKSPPEAPEEGDDVYDVYSRSSGVGMNNVPYRQW
ncbi:type II secretion system protein [Burkholderia sp. 22PA0099]|uniref:type II secretion system protein n=1 Tax=Burkholderia sp. 22PA0099 TaxID=3237372 RepID=UPI0039C2DAEB